MPRTAEQCVTLNLETESNSETEKYLKKLDILQHNAFVGVNGLYEHNAVIRPKQHVERSRQNH